MKSSQWIHVSERARCKRVQSFFLCSSLAWRCALKWKCMFNFSPPALDLIRIIVVLWYCSSSFTWLCATLIWLRLTARDHHVNAIHFQVNIYMRHLYTIFMKISTWKWNSSHHFHQHDEKKNMQFDIIKLKINNIIISHWNKNVTRSTINWTALHAYICLIFNYVIEPCRWMNVP